MIQKLTKLSEKTKAVIIPNTILKQLDNPEAFEMEVEDDIIVLKPLNKESSKDTKVSQDNSIDLYIVD